MTFRSPIYSGEARYNSLYNFIYEEASYSVKERFVYYPTISPRKVEQIWSELFLDLTNTILDEFAQSGSIDLVPGYATATSGEALKAITGLTQVRFEDLDAWSQAMIDGIANYTGDPDIEARCLAATKDIDQAIDQRLPQSGTRFEQDL